MTNNNEVRDAVSPDRTLYDRALRASGREAAATLAAAAFTMAYFWAAVWLLEDSDMTILSMPVWFMASCVGGYFRQRRGRLGAREALLHRHRP